jgi:hypothetical protein
VSLNRRPTFFSNEIGSWFRIRPFKAGNKLSSTPKGRPAGTTVQLQHRDIQV